MITVVNKHKHIPTNNDIYIGRGSVLGNTFTSIQDRKTKAEFICKDLEESIEKHKEKLLLDITNKQPEICKELNRIYSLSLKGDINLVCFCKPKRCHCDTIKEIIESKLNGK